MSTDSLTAAMTDRDFEQVVLCRDPQSGLESVIAVHDTTLGPSLGGIRMRAYPGFDAAVADALNLAEAMTYKAALAGLDLGGGKSVINADPADPRRADLLAAHARFIQSLSGRYIPAVDMGTTVDDLELIAQYTDRVSSQRRDPSYYTARGVVAAIRAAVQLNDAATLSGARVAVQGLGHVGRLVVSMLTEQGAHTVVSDIDATRVREAVDEFGAVAVAPDDILLGDVDVLCPCAAGGVVDDVVAEDLKARYVIGAANNVLSSPAVAAQLAARRILHVPDFVANAGGLIACDAEIRGDDAALLDMVDRIGDTSARILAQARDRDTSSVQVAIDLARARLASRRAARPFFTRA